MPSAHRGVAGSRRQFLWRPCSPCSGDIRGRADGRRSGSPSRLRPTCSASRTARSSWSPGGASRSTSRIAMRSGMVSATAGWWVAIAPSSVSAVGGVVAAKQDCLEDARFKLEDARIADVDPGEKHQREPPWSSRSGAFSDDSGWDWVGRCRIRRKRVGRWRLGRRWQGCLGRHGRHVPDATLAQTDRESARVVGVRVDAGRCLGGWNLGSRKRPTGCGAELRRRTRRARWRRLKLSVV